MGSGGLEGVSAEYPPRACLRSEVQRVVCNTRGRNESGEVRPRGQKGRGRGAEVQTGGRPGDALLTPEERPPRSW